MIALAPMEDVSDAVFRKMCRSVGATLCFTEFVNCEGLLRGSHIAIKKLSLAPDDQPTAVQIYGSTPSRLAEAAQVAEAAGSAFIDINCGCWVPKVAGQGAGAAWLRDPAAMVAMAEMVVKAVKVPVTVKTRIGLGPESHMPVIELAQRLESVGVRAMTIHCRTAQMGHSGKADWEWARRAQEVVKIPVIVNGDVCSAEDAQRAMDQTHCAGVMIGRRAIDYPWVFREVREWLVNRVRLAPPTIEERFAFSWEHLNLAFADQGERGAMHVARRHVGGYLTGMVGVTVLRKELNQARTFEEACALLKQAQSRL